ncbi:hypothetical protein DFH08DRAFT_1085756 [Mycena albidolilacea]|uniref:Uncharacterized protein n=1 Tax=Mycena albidolilacea TaxID=1033008 RepID=A0AAD6ZGH8_9AGAR|nr:hypothetical protein DFH08DRAFT_1085756 [Mycena albidolilacea]
MPGTVKKLVELLPQRAAAQESGQPGSANNCADNNNAGNAEEKDVAFFVLERFAASGRVEGFRKAFHSVPANDQGFICEGAHPNHGNVVPVAVVPLPHRLTPLEVLVVVKTRADKPATSRVVGRRFIGAPEITTSMQHNIDNAESPASALPCMWHFIKSFQRERLRATRLTFSLRTEVGTCSAFALLWKAKLLAGMRAAAVCLQPGTRVHLPGPSIAGLAGVNRGVCQRPGEDEEADLKAEIQRLQHENVVLLSSIQAATQALNDMEAGQIEDEEDETSDGSTEI